MHKRAFTLIELLLAMLVLSLFLTAITTTYLRLAGAQRDANKTRKIYAEARNLMDVLGDQVRSHSIDWECYLDTGDCGVTNFVNVPVPVEILSLLDRSGESRVQYRIMNGRLQVLKQVRDIGGGWVYDSTQGFSSNTFLDFGTENIDVEGGLFYITPHGDRLYSDEFANNLLDDAFHYQPQVTFALGFTATSADSPGGRLRFSLQTTVSSRVY